MNKMLSIAAIGFLAFAAQASEIKVTLGANGEAAKDYAFTASSKPYVIDQRVAKKYDSHVGCKGFDTSKLQSEVAVGRVVEVIQEGAFADGALLGVKFSNTEFKGTNPHKVNSDCTVNNQTSTTRSGESHVFLKRGEPVVIDPSITLLLN